ncbi:MAG: DUF1232 domain-containing protein [Algicola sp.]|nr:DUF1232 domain-containing protein [Algicola sp.]
MAFEIKFELQDSDLDYFREVMRKALAGAERLEESAILEKAGQLSGEVKGTVPEFVSLRLKKLDTLIAMIKDEEWKIPDEERRDVLGALAYFSDPLDLVPDHIPVLGFLDDAIMIELVVEELAGDVEAYEEFCEYRIREVGRRGDDTITREEWLADKRRELHSRMRNRRSGRSARGRRRLFR